MILTEKIIVGVSANNIKHYNNYFDKIKIGDKINISPDKLPIGSHQIILSQCDICGIEKNIPYRDYIKSFNKGGSFTCNKCKGYKVKNTLLNMYNSINYHNIEKSKKTCLEKYGCENVFQNEDIKNKIKETNLIKYGVEFTSQTEHNKNKIKETNLEKYGFEHHLQNKEILQKQHDTNLERYGVEYYLKSDIYKNKRTDYLLKEFDLKVINFNKSIYEIKCDKCNNNYKIKNNLMLQRLKIKTDMCTICNPVNSSAGSGYENQLINFIKSNYGIIMLLNDRHMGKELDIYLPELKLAFEFNGIYWHNEIKVSNDYHLNKTELCEKNGIKLIHIYEDDWLYKQNIIKSRILNLLGKSNKIMARKCEIKELTDNKLVREFLKINHLQGFVGSQVKIGLFHDGELVSLMTFGSQRKAMGQKSIEDSYEMLRFCNKLNTNVIGGASKLFKYFIKNYNPVEVISYADRSWSTGDLYEKLGFKFVHKTKQNYYYVIDGIRKHRFEFRKDVLVKNGADPNKTEHEIMLEKGIFRVYDSGNLKFIWPS